MKLNAKGHKTNLTRQSKSIQHRQRIALSGATEEIGVNTADIQLEASNDTNSTENHLAVGCAIKGFAENVLRKHESVDEQSTSNLFYLLHFRTPICVDLLTCAFAKHLFLGVDVHGDFKERLVQEWDACFQTPGHS